MSTRTVYLLQFGDWWNPFSWRLMMRYPMQVRRLKGKQIPVLLWPQELVTFSELRERDGQQATTKGD